MKFEIMISVSLTSFFHINMYEMLLNEKRKTKNEKRKK